MTLKKKIWSSVSELKWTKIEQFGMWIVNSDRQFCGTVYVISWTVVLILSPSEYGDLRKIGKHVCIIPRLCWYNKELFCTKSGQIRQRRGIYITGILTSEGIDNLFIGELLVTGENRTLHFQTVTYSWKGGIRRRKIGKLRINWIVSWSVIYLSGRTQGSDFWADLLTVSSSLETFNSFG